VRFFKNNNQLPYDFSDEKIEGLSKSIEELKLILQEIGTSTYMNCLNSILYAASQADDQKFKDSVLINSLFGGAGSL
jgi:hypothetical protein